MLIVGGVYQTLNPLHCYGEPRDPNLVGLISGMMIPPLAQIIILRFQPNFLAPGFLYVWALWEGRVMMFLFNLEWVNLWFRLIQKPKDEPQNELSERETDFQTHQNAL